jgi:type IV pilus assembly protein PilQ
VQDTASRLDDVRRILNRIDVTVRQVLIEARIVIADDGFSRQLGARFGSQAGWRLTNNYNVGTSGTLPAANGGTSNPSDQYANGLTPGAQLPLAGPLNVNLPVGAAAGTLALSFLNLGSGNLINLELDALETNNRGKVISSPRVITSDNQKAEIVQGTQIPYITPGSGAASIPAVAFKDAVLSLAVTPHITPDGKVIMLLEVKKDSVGQIVNLGVSGGLVPSIDTKRVTTQIAVNNGETAVLGGIFEENLRQDITKVPWLGDMPVLGYLFRTTTRSNSKTELLIFITPRIVTESVTSVR